MVKFELKAAAASEIGLCKGENQDCVLALIGEGYQGDFGLFAVADGMGGVVGGKQAAGIAMLVCENWWKNVLPELIAQHEAQVLPLALKTLEEAANQINEAVIALGQRIDAMPGTTFSTLFIYGRDYVFVHVGDSRIYKAARRLEQLTRDDTWIACQIRYGAMTAEQAEKHPKKHVLTQCAGSNTRIQVHTGRGSFGQGNGFILCTDGFYNHQTEDEILRLAQSGKNMNACLTKAFRDIYGRGAKDNLSAIVIAT